MITNETTLHKRPNDTKINNLGHRTAINNEQRPYRIVSFKRPRNINVKLFEQKTNGLIYIQNMNEKQNFTPKQTTTAE